MDISRPSIETRPDVSQGIQSRLRIHGRMPGVRSQPGRLLSPVVPGLSTRHHQLSCRESANPASSARRPAPPATPANTPFTRGPVTPGPCVPPGGPRRHADSAARPSPTPSGRALRGLTSFGTVGSRPSAERPRRSSVSCSTMLSARVARDHVRHADRSHPGSPGHVRAPAHRLRTPRSSGHHPGAGPGARSRPARRRYHWPPLSGLIDAQVLRVPHGRDIGLEVRACSTRRP